MEARHLDSSHSIMYDNIKTLTQDAGVNGRFKSDILLIFRCIFVSLPHVDVFISQDQDKHV